MRQLDARPECWESFCSLWRLQGLTNVYPVVERRGTRLFLDAPKNLWSECRSTSSSSWRTADEIGRSSKVDEAMRVSRSESRNVRMAQRESRMCCICFIIISSTDPPFAATRIVTAPSWPTVAPIVRLEERKVGETIEKFGLFGKVGAFVFLLGWNAPTSQSEEGEMVWVISTERWCCY